MPKGDVLGVATYAYKLFFWSILRGENSDLSILNERLAIA